MLKSKIVFCHLVLLSRGNALHFFCLRLIHAGPQKFPIENESESRQWLNRDHQMHNINEVKSVDTFHLTVLEIMFFVEYCYAKTKNVLLKL